MAMKDGTKYIDERTGDIWEIRHKNGIAILWNEQTRRGLLEQWKTLTKALAPHHERVEP